jgi:hypothetical protein
MLGLSTNPLKLELHSHSARFKGTDVTFEEFPDRIKHLVKATLPKVVVKSEVFPVYETKGDLVR